MPVTQHLKSEGTPASRMPTLPRVHRGVCLSHMSISGVVKAPFGLLLPSPVCGLKDDPSCSLGLHRACHHCLSALALTADMTPKTHQPRLQVALSCVLSDGSWQGEGRRKSAHACVTMSLFP
ncbi:hypothetical protein AOLI_G00096340 [Acnodon oligacanthus]